MEDDTTTRELAKEALSGDDGSTMVLADTMEERGRLSVAIVLRGDDEDEKRELLRQLAAGEEVETSDFVNRREKVGNLEIIMSFVKGYGGDGQYELYVPQASPDRQIVPLGGDADAAKRVFYNLVGRAEDWSGSGGDLSEDQVSTLMDSVEEDVAELIGRTW